MPLIKWKNKYTVNNQQLDSDHKKIFDLFNKMYDECLATGTVACTCIMLDELISFTEYHCKTEEDYMAKIGYNNLEEHIIKHNDIMQRLRKIKQDQEDNLQTVTMALMVLIGNWIRLHIIEEDMKYNLEIQSESAKSIDIVPQEPLTTRK